MLIFITAARPLRCQPDKSRRCRQPGVGKGLQEGWMWVPTLLLFAQPSWQRARGCGTALHCQAGGWRDAEAEIRALLCSESPGGTKSAQPRPRSTASSAGSLSPSASFSLRHLPAAFGCFSFMQLPISTLTATPKCTWF